MVAALNRHLWGKGGLINFVVSFWFCVVQTHIFFYRIFLYSIPFYSINPHEFRGGNSNSIAFANRACSLHRSVFLFSHLSGELLK